MRDYLDACRSLSVPELAREVLDGSLDGGISAAVECCDRWALNGRVALYWTGKDFAEKTVTFETLREQSSRFANLLRARGIGQGDVEVFNSVVSDLHSARLVTYALPESGSTFHSVRILPTRNLTLQFRCRRGYYRSGSSHSEESP